METPAQAGKTSACGQTPPRGPPKTGFFEVSESIDRKPETVSAGPCFHNSVQPIHRQAARASTCGLTPALIPRPQDNPEEGVVDGEGRDRSRPTKQAGCTGWPPLQGRPASSRGRQGEAVCPCVMKTLDPDVSSPVEGVIRPADISGFRSGRPRSRACPRPLEPASQRSYGCWTPPALTKPGRAAGAARRPIPPGSR